MLVDSALGQIDYFQNVFVTHNAVGFEEKQTRLALDISFERERTVSCLPDCFFHFEAFSFIELMVFKIHFSLKLYILAWSVGEKKNPSSMCK